MEGQASRRDGATVRPHGRSREHARALEEIVERLLEPERELEPALRTIGAALDVELVKVLDLRADRTALDLTAGIGWAPDAVGHARVGPGDESQAGHTLKTGGPVLVRDLARERRFRGPELLREHGAVSGASVVIGVSPHPLGVLGAHDRRARAFTAAEAGFLEDAADLVAAALALERARRALAVYWRPGAGLAGYPRGMLASIAAARGAAGGLLRDGILLERRRRLPLLAIVSEQAALIRGDTEGSGRTSSS